MTQSPNLNQTYYKYRSCDRSLIGFILKLGVIFKVIF